MPRRWDWRLRSSCCFHFPQRLLIGGVRITINVIESVHVPVVIATDASRGGGLWSGSVARTWHRARHLGLLLHRRPWWLSDRDWWGDNRNWCRTANNVDTTRCQQGNAAPDLQVPNGNLHS